MEKSNILLNKLNKAIDNGNTLESDMIINELYKNESIDIDASMPQNFAKKVKGKSKAHHRGAKFILLEAAIFCIIVGCTIFAGKNYIANSKMFRRVPIVLNDEKIDSSKYIDDNGYLYMQLNNSDKVKITADNIEGTIVIVTNKDQSKRIYSQDDLQVASTLASLDNSLDDKCKLKSDPNTSAYYEFGSGGDVSGSNYEIYGCKKVVNIYFVQN